MIDEKTHRKLPVKYVSESAACMSAIKRWCYLFWNKTFAEFPTEWQSQPMPDVLVTPTRCFMNSRDI
jgi:hypothetical protein